jgi:5'-deoxynucleotidase YfbR-like HD superfamily hydrolase
VLSKKSYSHLKASTGFLLAAFHDCQETVRRAIIMAVNPARAKIHQLRVVL